MKLQFHRDAVHKDESRLYFFSANLFNIHNVIYMMNK